MFSASTFAVAKMTDIVPSAMNMIAEPHMSSFLRPTRSTRTTARIVPAMFTTELMTLVKNASFSLNPTDCHSDVE